MFEIIQSPRRYTVAELEAMRTREDHLRTRLIAAGIRQTTFEVRLLPAYLCIRGVT